MTNWPDPARPGVPANPLKNGPHSLTNPPDNPHKGPWVLLWCGQELLWTDIFGSRFTPAEMAKMVYVGPCLTPDEAAAAQIEAEKEGYAVAHDSLIDLRRELQFDPNSTNNERWLQAGILTGIYYACKAIDGLPAPSKPFNA
jgi:hypothetical protein